MKRRSWIATGVVAAALAGGAGIAVASGGDDTEPAITGEALAKASAAALGHTGGGRVTETEMGDEESFYELEVTRPDGSRVDVQLDRDFHVVGSSPDRSDPGDDEES